MPINQHMSETAALRSRRFLLGANFLISAFLFIITVFIFRNTNLDIAIQKLFWHPGTGWYLKDFPLFRILYHYGNLPALLLSVAGLVLFGLSYQAMKWAKWRKIGAFLALVMILGPGLIINTTLKDNWGRPRPRNVTEFGGKYSYEKVLSIDTSSPGKSFPCGHASMGFYLFIPWFVLRKKRKGWAYASLVTGILFGLAIGIARMAQGGHWASDVIIAGILVYLTGLLIFHLLKLNKAIWFYPKYEEIDRAQRSIVGIIVLIFITFMIFAVFLATPYSDKKTYASRSYTDAGLLNRIVSIDVPEADLVIGYDDKTDSLTIYTKSQGFGFPGSRLKNTFTEKTENDTLKLLFHQVKKGWLTELDNLVKINFPYLNSNRLDVHLGKGSATIIVPDKIKNLDLNITVDDGKLALLMPKTFKPRITTKGDFKLIDKTGFTSFDSIFIKEDFKVDIIVRKGELTLY
jgi:lipid A 4'-phosphatase